MTQLDKGTYNFIDARTASEVTGSIYLSRKEASRYLGVSEKYLATHLVDGPPRIRVASNRTKYRLCDLETWMRQREVR